MQLFDLEFVKLMGHAPFKQKDIWVLEENQFNSKGFLIKSFALNLVETEAIKPTLAELQRFKDFSGVFVTETAANLNKKSCDKAHHFGNEGLVKMSQDEFLTIDIGRNSGENFKYFMQFSRLFIIEHDTRFETFKVFEIMRLF